ncbi:MAG: hypothetical protein A2X84_10265 [Desulfuromonadaceae bacterium GWC2_58_13]|nr:MAG: hypothetical protein A2X84_10265 [Desulfuromonadaceae bacterium GWC2_58_13]
MHEAHFGAFRRRLMLPDGVNAEMIRASCKDGVPEIGMPMEKISIRGRKIAIVGGRSRRFEGSPLNLDRQSGGRKSVPPGLVGGLRSSGPEKNFSGPDEGLFPGFDDA